MGQTHSQQMSPDEMYSMYIQQQQNLIIQQQQQINDLYHMNLEQSQQQTQPTPPNIAFQQPQPDPSLRRPSTKLDPYKILGIPKQFDETMLKKAYLKKR